MTPSNQILYIYRSYHGRTGKRLVHNPLKELLEGINLEEDTHTVLHLDLGRETIDTPEDMSLKRTILEGDDMRMRRISLFSTSLCHKI